MNKECYKVGVWVSERERERPERERDQRERETREREREQRETERGSMPHWTACQQMCAPQHQSCGYVYGYMFGCMDVCEWVWTCVQRGWGVESIGMSCSPHASLWCSILQREDGGVFGEGSSTMINQNTHNGDRNKRDNNYVRYNSNQTHTHTHTLSFRRITPTHSGGFKSFQSLEGFCQ